MECGTRDSSTWINIKIAFVLNDLHKSPDADLLFTGHGKFPGVSDEQLLKDLERAIKKGNDEGFPYNQEYKKRLIEMNRK